MSPLSDWRLPFSGFSSLSLQNKEMPFQKSAFHWRGAALGLGREERGMWVVQWGWSEPCPGAPHTPELPPAGFCYYSHKFVGIINTHLVGFFPFLPWAETMDRKGRGRKRGCWRGLEGSVPATRADVQSLEPHRETFHFTKHWPVYVKNVQGLIN